ncbi:hypothetical protein Tco_1439845 [Tanacetum coccineum]
MEESLSKFMNELAKRHEENSNMIKEIRAFMDAAIRNQGASIKMLEIQIGQISKVLHERGFGSLPSSAETNPRDHVKSISTAVETNMTRRHSALADLMEQSQVSSSSTFTTRLGELAHTKLIIELADRTVKHPKGIAENVLVWISKFVFPVDFIILDMPEDINIFWDEGFMENMDIRPDKERGDIIIGEPFCKVSCTKSTMEETLAR